MFLGKVRHTCELVKISHSVFALPFALGAMLIAARGIPPFSKIMWILLAVVFARTAAMAFNRFADREIDAKNPRTASRHLPQRTLSKGYVLSLSLVSALLFMGAAFKLGWLCFFLSPLALLILFAYSYAKRFTHYTQLILGLSLGIAPVGAWIAIRGKIDPEVLVLGIAVLFWVAGFDILYAAQDERFDRQEKLYSMVVKMGMRNAFRCARIFHFLCFVFLIGFGVFSKLGWIYYGGLALMGGLFIYQHALVGTDRLSRINTAFFTVNGCISFLFLIGVAFSIII